MLSTKLGTLSLKEKKGNWILQIQLTELAFRLNDGIPELGETSTKNLITTCHTLGISDEEFLKQIQHENSFARQVWNSDLMFTGTPNDLKVTFGKSCSAFYMAGACGIPLLTDMHRPLVVYALMRQTAEKFETGLAAFMHECFREYCGVPNGDLYLPQELLIVWCLMDEHYDPVSASEIMMTELAKDGGIFVKGSKDNLAQHLANYLVSNPEHSVADLRSRYASSDTVQKWLDTVEAKLPR